MSRELASIQRITAILPIPDADNIEVAFVLGWQVVVKKGEFQPGDLAVYMEIDSVPPDEERYRFLWKDKDQRPNNFRIKTVKLRGQISQGILFPMKQCDEDRVWIDGEIGQEQGAIRCVEDDVTDLLGVTKYEAPLPNGSADVEGQFFDGVPKTDEDRIQSRADLVEALQGRPYYITVKCDGSSMTVAMHDGQPKVASRNYRLRKSEESAYHRAACNGWLYSFVENHPHLAVQGELVGPGIQNNRLSKAYPTCLVFNIYDRKEDRYLTLDEMEHYRDTWDLQLVPLIVRGTEFVSTQGSLLQMAEGKYAGTSNEREGIVIRSQGEPRISFKAISNRYLLKGGE